MKAGIVLETVLAALLMVPAASGQEEGQTPEAEEAAGSPSEQLVARPATRGERRDPFRTLIVKKEAAAAPTCTEPGKKGLLIGQLQVQGIVRGIGGGWIAMVDNNTKRAYFLREKDEVCNGQVSRIAADRVVFQENVTGALGRSSTREVIKRLPQN